jgi:hypothetical protein
VNLDSESVEHPARIALGYDLRIAPYLQRLAWNEERRSLFLLSKSVAAPLSFDRNVWPSALRRRGDSEQACEPWETFVVRETDWKFNAIGVVEDLAQIYDQFSAGTRKARMFWPIAIEAVLEPGEVLAWPIIELIEPLHFATEDWYFLGYDVIDTALSVLMNFGYGDEEYEDLYARFANSLNSNHLFSRYEDALAYKNVAPERDPDHAPYFVVALYRTNVSAALGII